jgi:ABC-type lipopolysaccharide export system ATPase subunit
MHDTSGFIREEQNLDIIIPDHAIRWTLRIYQLEYIITGLNFTAIQPKTQIQWP